MTWHLKNRKLEEALDVMSLAPFSFYLEKALKNRASKSDYIEVRLYRNPFSSVSKECVLWFNPKEIEEDLSYDAWKWNEFPKVKPPEKQMLRIELSDGGLIGGYYAFDPDIQTYDWFDAKGKPLPKDLSNKITRFRPWEY